jgi:hypothetical protein
LQATDTFKMLGVAASDIKLGNSSILLAMA